MIIDQFRDIPDYPFDCYFADPAQFLHARRYWLALLGDTKGFVAEQWQLTPRPETWRMKCIWVPCWICTRQALGR